MSNQKLKFLSIVFIAILFSCSTTKYSVATKENIASQKTDPLYEEIQKIGIQKTKQNNVPGLAIAYIQNGKIAWTQCIGYADVANQKPVTTQTVFNVGSISKVVAAWGFMQLTEKGIVKLDDPVNQYLTRWILPQSSFDISKVTLRRILSHTAGLSVHGYAGYEEGDQLPTLEESLSGKTKTTGGGVKLISEPGTRWDYSGGGYTLAQLVLEETTKETFADYMKTNVLMPLKMRNSDYRWTNKQKMNAATAYDTLGKPIEKRIIFTEQAAAGLQTTILDLARFAELSISTDTQQLNKVLKPETIKLMEQAVSPSSNEGESGLGYQIMNYAGLQNVGHTGENNGWFSAMFLNLPTKSGIVILCNGSNGFSVMIPVYASWANTVKAMQTGGH